MISRASAPTIAPTTIALRIVPIISAAPHLETSDQRRITPFPGIPRS
jgi:hypothetical protein